MKKQEAWDALIDYLMDNVHGVILGWHGEQVSVNLEGLRELPIETQLGLICETDARGFLRIGAEKVSNTAVKTKEMAAERITLASFVEYQKGTRIGTTRINTVEDAAKSIWFTNFKSLLEDKKEGAIKLAATYGITLEETVSDGGRKMKKLTGIDNPEFVAYLNERVSKEDYQEKGRKELARVQAERAAKATKGEAAL